jgi:hypothetical protein
MKRLAGIGLLIAVLLVACSRQAPAPTPDPLAASQDDAAKADLRNALVAAKTFWTDGSTYTGWGPSAGASIEPALSWGDAGPASVGTVSIDFAGGSQVVMSTMSASGAAFCIADDADLGTSYGAVDAHGATVASGCAGGPWGS